MGAVPLRLSQSRLLYASNPIEMPQAYDSEGFRPPKSSEPSKTKSDITEDPFAIPSNEGDEDGQSKLRYDFGGRYAKEANWTLTYGRRDERVTESLVRGLNKRGGK
ncbi:MAG: hypothetical protein L6R41_007561 [Letrouitia leprolyta]|nr:MAG: hypothetical protein L6R41_007561 [Letrouitia leprolyta]